MPTQESTPPSSPRPQPDSGGLAGATVPRNPLSSEAPIEELGRQRPTDWDRLPERLARSSFYDAESDSGPISSVQGRPVIIDGRYLVEDIQGEGSAGVVYLCRHLVLDRLVAIKVLRKDFLKDASVRARFTNEARAASAIGNEHIVDTIDYGTMQDGSTYLVMELLEGDTLGEVIATEGLLPFPRIIHIMRQVCCGLQAAHAAGIVHRDIKPDNLFIVDRGKRDFVKLLDFGVAKMAGALGHVTSTGAVFGTPHYMSPEQAGGKPTDARSDIYSVGVILFLLASGRLPFDAEAPLGILTQHLTARPPSLSESLPAHRRLPEGYEAVVRKCLSKGPAARYQTVAELEADLTKVEAGFAPGALSEIARRDGWHLIRAWGTDRRTLTLAALLAGVAVSGLWLRQPGMKRSEGAGEGVVAVMPIGSASANPPQHPKGDQAFPPESGQRVDLVLFPLDAHVFKGSEDLGAMPVSVQVPEKEHVTVLVKRKGYIARRLELDGTKSRVVVGLKHWKESSWGRALLREKREAAEAPSVSPLASATSSQGRSAAQGLVGDPSSAGKARQLTGTPGAAARPPRPLGTARSLVPAPTPFR